VEYFARMYEIATGVRIKVGLSREGFWVTYEKGGWLRSCWSTGLWKVFAELDPVNWLKGLFDSEGSVSPVCNNRKKVLASIAIKLVIGDAEIKRMVVRQLRRLGFKFRELYVAGEEREIEGRRVRFGEYWSIRFRGWSQAQKFAQLIGFRVSYRREMLQDLLKLKRFPPRIRYAIWTQWYHKEGHRWRRRPPSP